MKLGRWSHLTLAALLAAGVASSAFAAPQMIVNTAPRAPGADAVLDLSHARPMAMPQPSVPLATPDLQRSAEAAAAAGPARGEPARQKGIDASRAAQGAPKIIHPSFQEQGGVVPSAYGTSVLHFTTSKATNTDFNARNWPFRATGRLFFDTNGDSVLDSWCSASMIRRGVLVTAGHCMHSGNGDGSGWYGMWTYVPSYSATAGTPYGVWTNWFVGYVTGDWYAGGGAVPNQRDWGFIVYDVDGLGNRIGDYTGHLGWWTGRAIGRQMTTVGYPGNMWAGETQARTDSPTYDAGSAGNAMWGSDQRGGSSGSPVVVNFRNGYNNTAATPTENESNRVSSVISWGYIDTDPMVQGGSNFDSVFVDMLDTLCTNYPTLACP